ncbi:hypothetical protein BDQ12DRAFT_629820 [Crucibulum laeve]|uniref:F-box domain-containing protein n=1 Tax=Crucibulum laeve TaxID=68775 RepID=A0A5C3M385_9AGAR|nr:hypothetical protein BDQ12DRAFT_629820 [Crucibulum laeve]
MSATLNSCTWSNLPTEMKLAIVDALAPEDVKSMSQVDQRTYQACVPATFKTVKLNNYDALQKFLENVPRSYCSHIQELEICTQNEEGEVNILLRTRTDSVIALLSACSRLTKLTLKMAGSLDKSIIAPFPFLNNLKHLTIANCGEENSNPLSERLVVSIAASVQNLQELSLDRISRSKLHAPELEGAYPYVPLVVGDDDIPDHPLLGSELCLPSLLRIPNLRKLTIRDTHLGDERWTTTPVACRLQVLDLGSCYHEDEDFNSACTERIMSTVGRTIDEFSLTTAVSDSVFAKPAATPLQRLRKLHITPFFPVDSVVDTMTNLAGSPIENLSLQCYEDDMVDMCEALESFLSRRVERGPQFYDKLKRIDIAITAADGASTPSAEEVEERAVAAKRLQDFCRDLRLASVVGKFNSLAEKAPRPTSLSFTDWKRPTSKARSMTI